MIRSTNEIERFIPKNGKYFPSKKLVTLRPVKNCEGMLTEIYIDGKSIIVDAKNLLIASRNCSNTGSGLMEEIKTGDGFGIEGLAPELKV